MRKVCTRLSLAIDDNTKEFQDRFSALGMRDRAYLPTRARITVKSGAAGKAIVVFISSICNKSTEKYII